MPMKNALRPAHDMDTYREMGAIKWETGVYKIGLYDRLYRMTSRGGWVRSEKNITDFLLHLDRLIRKQKKKGSSGQGTLF